MANGTQVLREYLLSLGFKVNTTEAKKFDGVIENISKKAIKGGTALVGMGTAAAAMVTVFANSMEKLYYASRRTGSTVERLQAMESGAERIGISGGQMRASIENMARSLRTSPGLAAVLQSFGVKVQGRDMSDVAKDAVRAFRQMPFYVGSRFAAMFGMDPDTFMMMSQGLEELEAAEQRRLDLNKEIGLNQQDAAKASVEYMNTLRDVNDQFEVMKGAAAVALLPAFKEAAQVTQQILKDWAVIFKNWEKEGGAGGLLGKFLEGVTGLSANRSGPVTLTKEAQARVDAMNGKKPPAPIVYDGTFKSAAQTGKIGQYFSDMLHPANKITTAGQTHESQELFGRLEKQYALPSGLLDTIWSMESSRGKNMLSPAGAKGHFQFMPGTAKDFGIEGKENDLGASADAAARYFQQLLKKFGGNLEIAMAAYNWGPNRKALIAGDLGAAPEETRNYAHKGMQMMQTNHIVIHGATDPYATGDQVSRAIAHKTGNTLRDLTGAHQ